MGALEYAVRQGYALPVRFAMLTRSLRQAPDPLASLRSLVQRLRAPNDCREIASVALRHAESAKQAEHLPAAAVLALLEGCDAFRRPERLEALLCCCEGESFGERGWAETPYRPRAILFRALAAAAGVDAAAIARRTPRQETAAGIRATRIEAISHAMDGGK